MDLIAVGRFRSQHLFWSAIFWDQRFAIPRQTSLWFRPSTYCLEQPLDSCGNSSPGLTVVFQLDSGTSSKCSCPRISWYDFIQYWFENSSWDSSVLNGLLHIALAWLWPDLLFSQAHRSSPCWSALFLSTSSESWQRPCQISESAYWDYSHVSWHYVAIDASCGCPTFLKAHRSPGLSCAAGLTLASNCRNRPFWLTRKRLRSMLVTFPKEMPSPDWSIFGKSSCSRYRLTPSPEAPSASAKPCSLFWWASSTARPVVFPSANSKNIGYFWLLGYSEANRPIGKWSLADLSISILHRYWIKYLLVLRSNKATDSRPEVQQPLRNYRGLRCDWEFVRRLRVEQDWCSLARCFLEHAPFLIWWSHHLKIQSWLLATSSVSFRVVLASYCLLQPSRCILLILGTGYPSIFWNPQQTDLKMDSAPASSMPFEQQYVLEFGLCSQVGRRTYVRNGCRSRNTCVSYHCFRAL